MSPAADIQLKEPEPIWEKGSVSFGGVVAVFNSSLSLGANNLGITADAEKLLNLQTELTVFQLNAMYRPGETRATRLISLMRPTIAAATVFLTRIL